MKVDVYYNYHQKLFSVRARSGPNRGRVVLRSPKVDLVNVEFVVSKAGRERVLHEKRKNVHAVVRGELRAIAPDTVREITPSATRLHYNPYDAGHFQTWGGNRVTAAEEVRLRMDRAGFPKMFGIGLTEFPI